MISVFGEVNNEFLLSSLDSIKNNAIQMMYGIVAHDDQFVLDD